MRCRREVRSTLSIMIYYALILTFLFYQQGKAILASTNFSKVLIFTLLPQ